MIRKLGHLAGGKKGRFVTIIIWFAILVILNFAFPQANSRKMETAGDLNKNTPSQQAKVLTEKEFPSDKGTPALTFHHKTPLMPISCLGKEI
ncbi:hypothetical protein D1B31_08410 [Neobacillus notoginsengisoli]|uniref:Uncharacterized protein n=1 Tax=Neobacillus notoginsengisoli TaxID=1578198 RepID=A0A417YWC5_9BACI|nr:hypothetical protein [Neobacillus notoginsengisoli]RHW41723.1 hypothetical protein D1B31_08410 [Neobacillus notoginsengisoli]